MFIAFILLATASVVSACSSSPASDDGASRRMVDGNLDLEDVAHENFALHDSMAVDASSALDGTSLDGTSLDGTSLDGTSLDGTSLDGTSLDGTSDDISNDGGAPRDPFALLPACPSSREWSCRPSTCEVIRLHSGDPAAFPFQIASDQGHVYWVAQDQSSERDSYNGRGLARIYRASKDGREVAQLARAQTEATTIALDGDHVYWVARGDRMVFELRRVSRRSSCQPSCQSPEVIASFPAGVQITRLRRSRPGELLALGDVGQLYRVSVDGREPTTLIRATSHYADIAVHENTAWVGGGSSPVVARVHVSTGEDAGVLTIPARDGGVGTSRLATDCMHVYLQGHPDGTVIFRARLNASTAETFFTAGTWRLMFDMAVDENFIYFAEPNAGGVYALAKSGRGDLVRFASGNVWFVAADEDGVYWGEHGRSAPGAIFMLRKRAR